MAVNTVPIFPGALRTAGKAIVAADTTSALTLLAGGTYGTRIDAISASSTDSTDRSVQFLISDGGNSYIIGTINVPAGAGNTAAVLPVQILSSLVLPWLDTSGSFFLANGWSLLVKATSTVASGALHILASCGDY